MEYNAQVIDIIFNYFIIKKILQNWLLVERRVTSLKIFLKCSWNFFFFMKIYCMQILSSYFGFRLHFEPNFRPKPKSWAKPKLISNRNFGRNQNRKFPIASPDICQGWPTFSGSRSKFGFKRLGGPKFKLRNCGKPKNWTYKPIRNQNTLLKV